MFKFKDKRLIIPVIYIFLAVFFLCILITPLRIFTLNILKFPLSIVSLGRREIGGMIFYHRNFIENEKLKKERDLLRHRLNAMHEIYLENMRLGSLLSFKQKSPFKVIAARVIGRSPDNWSSLVIIDKGSYSGIKRQAPVLTYLGLAGRVIEVTEYTSKIMLINDPNLGVSSISQRSRQEGLVSGTLGGYLVMKYLPKDADIKASDIVVTSGLTEIYPKGLLVGTVVNVGEEFSGLSRYAIIKPAVNLSDLEEVLVVAQ